MRIQMRDKALLYAPALIVLSLLLYTIKMEISKPEVAYVDIGKMLESYTFRKDLEAEGTKNLYQIRNTVDSLKLARKMTSNPVIDSQIRSSERAFEHSYTFLNQELTKKVWERLNPLLEEFGKAQGYALLIGANGAGTVLYGNKKNDVTAEAISYINNNYGKEK